MKYPLSHEGYDTIQSRRKLLAKRKASTVEIRHENFGFLERFCTLHALCLFAAVVAVVVVDAVLAVLLLL